MSPRDVPSGPRSVGTRRGRGAVSMWEGMNAVLVEAVSRPLTEAEVRGLLGEVAAMQSVIRSAGLAARVEWCLAGLRAEEPEVLSRLAVWSEADRVRDPFAARTLPGSAAEAFRAVPLGSPWPVRGVPARPGLVEVFTEHPEG